VRVLLSGVAIAMNEKWLKEHYLGDMLTCPTCHLGFALRFLDGTVVYWCLGDDKILIDVTLRLFGFDVPSWGVIVIEL